MKARNCQGSFGEFGSTPVLGKPGIGIDNAEVGAGIETTVGATTSVGVEVGVGVMVTGVGVGVGVGMVTGVTTTAAQVGLVTESVSNVTAPLRAKTLPLTTAPVVTVTEVKAKRVPTKVEFVPRVADEATCQKTLQAWAPLIRFTLLADAVVRADPTWKIKTAFGFPCPSNVNVPVRPSDDAELYTPGVNVRPPRSPDTVIAPV